ncbi:MAG: DUF362 domain-containing protein [Phycisphaerae bacterium]|nr:DUF362 domain-containing protein [Phycisphaerae bacterium]
MTLETLEAVGGIRSIVHEGETVFIKPNLAGLGFVGFDPVPAGESVKPEIVVVVAEECLKAGAAKVVIGEGGQARFIPWQDAWTLDGTVSLVQEVARLNATYPGEVSLASLEADSPAWDPVPSPHTDLGEIYISSLVARADRIISIAVPKSHRWTYLTASMKNFVGTTTFDKYGYGMAWRFLLHNAAGGVSQCFLDIVNAIKPDLAIIDGSICCEGSGPHVMSGWWGETIDVSETLGDWFMLGSTDLAAADAIVAQIVGLGVGGVPYLAQARDQGIGQVDPDKIEVVGVDVDDLRVDFKPADHTVGFNEVILPGIMLMFFSG